VVTALCLQLRGRVFVITIVSYNTIGKPFGMGEPCLIDR
jgi:hypothetical protein